MQGFPELQVAIAAGPASYAVPPPYSPSQAYPESILGREALSEQANGVYAAVRESFHQAGLDADRFGSRTWNPLGALIVPGQTVVLKPNFVREFRETQPGDGECTITHGSVIRAVLDYAFIAMEGRGRLIIADAPQNDADFDQIRRIAGLDAVQAFYREQGGAEVEVYDLRPEKARKVDGVIVGHEALGGDPAGYAKVDLGRRSAFSEIDDLCHLLYGAEYDTSELREHHRAGVHEYLVSRTVLDADCVISIPKLKTHKKTGITASMKNLVGISGNKNWLPHHRQGTPAQGGDQYADNAVRHRVERRLTEAFKRVFPRMGPLRKLLAGSAKNVGRRIFGDTNVDAIRSGNWHGNDTTWRMVIDLNRILRYAGSDGALRDRPVRRVFCVVDAIVAGEGNGPLDCTPRPCGVILAGENPVHVDAVCAMIMGFDHSLLPMVSRALEPHSLPLASSLNSGEHWRRGSSAPFAPHFGWRKVLRPHAGRESPS